MDIEIRPRILKRNRWKNEIIDGVEKIMGERKIRKIIAIIGKEKSGVVTVKRDWREEERIGKNSQDRKV